MKSPSSWAWIPIAIRMKNYAAKDPGSDQDFTAKHLDECYRRGADDVRLG